MEDVNSLIYQADLMRAIEEGALPDIVENLRLLAKLGPIPAEIILKLCNYLDLDRPAIRSGPKDFRKFSRNIELVEDYLFLCAEENCEVARYFYYSDDEIKLPIFMQSRRNWPKDSYRSHSYPSRGQIRDKLCEKYSIKKRRFESILSEYKLILAHMKYNEFVEGYGYDREVAAKQVCEEYEVDINRFSAFLLPQ